MYMYIEFFREKTNTKKEYDINQTAKANLIDLIFVGPLIYLVIT